MVSIKCNKLKSHGFDQVTGMALIISQALELRMSHRVTPEAVTMVKTMLRGASKAQRG